MKNYRLFREIIIETYKVLRQNQRKKAIQVFVLIVFSSLFELLGVTAILPFVEAMVMPEKIMNNSLVRQACSLLGISNNKEVIFLLGCFIILIYIIKNLFIIFVNNARYSYSTMIQKDISVRILKSYIYKPYEFFLNTNSSEILRNCTSVPTAFNMVMEALFGLATEILTIMLVGAYLLYTDVITSVAVIVVLAVIIFVMMKIFKPIMVKSGEAYKVTDAQKYKAVNQIFQGIKDIKVMARQKFFVRTFDEVAEESRKAFKSYNVVNGSYDRIIEGICVSCIIGIVSVRLLLGSDEMLLFVPNMAVFAMGAFRIMPSVGKMANRVSNILYYRPLQQEVYKVLRDEKCVDEYNENVNSVCEISDLKEKSFVLRLNHVVWQYSDKNKPILQDLCINIRKGESIGLIGSSGAGKTTVADIILGLFKPQSGNVSINDIIISDVADWYKIVSYVPQNVYMLDDSIRANIVFGREYKDDNDIWKALEQAQLMDYVKKLPKGLDTVIGERGIKFSGGERQRLAIARALYIKPEILVMDEATASLDGDTENALMQAIETLQGEITLIIVAHRLNTIRKCDRVYEIKDGRAKEINKNDLAIY